MYMYTIVLTNVVSTTLAGHPALPHRLVLYCML